MSRRIVREAITPTNFTRRGDPYKKLKVGQHRKFQQNEYIRLLEPIKLEPEDFPRKRTGKRTMLLLAGTVLKYIEFDSWDGMDLENPQDGPYFFQLDPFVMVHGRWMTWLYNNPDAYERVKF